LIEANPRPGIKACPARAGTGGSNPFSSAGNESKKSKILLKSPFTGVEIGNQKKILENLHRIYVMYCIAVFCVVFIWYL